MLFCKKLAECNRKSDDEKLDVYNKIFDTLCKNTYQI